MRTIKCDKCGYEHIFTSEDDTFDGIRHKNIYIIVGSDHASDEPIQRVEHYKRSIDLCLNCQKELKQLYDEASDAAFAVIDKWLNPESPKTEVATIPQNQGDCNNCKHNGTWACLKCHGFDKYERAT